MSSFARTRTRVRCTELQQKHHSFRDKHVRLPWQKPKTAEHMTRRDKKRIEQLIDAGWGDTAIAREVKRSRTTVWRYRLTLQEQRARTAVEQRTAHMQAQLVERFIKSVEKLDLESC